MQKVVKLFKANIRQYAMLLALAAIVILFQITTKGVLLKPLNITNIIQQNSYILILAIGMLLCILTGNIDLSVGSVAAFVGAIAAVMMVNLKMPVFLSVLIALLVGGLIGAWQGFWCAYARILPFIVTLAGQLVFRGLTMVILQGQTIAPMPSSFQTFSSGFLPDIIGTGGTGDGTLHLTTLAIGVLLCAVLVFIEMRGRNNQRKHGFETVAFPLWIAKIVLTCAVVMWFIYQLSVYKGLPTVLILLGFLVALYTFVTQNTIMGRNVYAFGGNEKAAKLSGINTNSVFFWVYVNMGVLAALAGLVFAGRLNAATPKAGTNFELDAIASCFIGGASATGGIGTIIGAIIGGLIMGVLNNGMSIMGVSIDWQQTIKGLVLLAAVAFDVYTKNKSSK